ncbi:hypothetical protein EBR66_08060 [bacterium]|nr:hypothetical protein [bacterium]
MFRQGKDTLWLHLKQWDTNIQEYMIMPENRFEKSLWNIYAEILQRGIIIQQFLMQHNSVSSLLF